ncbi:hypothetical protein Dimus_035751 [Dionaea muscipula]
MAGMDVAAKSSVVPTDVDATRSVGCMDVADASVPGTNVVATSVSLVATDVGCQKFHSVYGRGCCNNRSAYGHDCSTDVTAARSVVPTDVASATTVVPTDVAVAIFVCTTDVAAASVAGTNVAPMSVPFAACRSSD